MPPNHTFETYLAKNEMLLVDLRNMPPKYTWLTYPETDLQVKDALPPALFAEKMHVLWAPTQLRAD